MLEKRKIDKLKTELRNVGQVLRVLGANLYDLNVIATELGETQTSFYKEERTEEELMKVVATVYEEWLILTYGVTNMSHPHKRDAKPLPITRTAEFEDLLNFEQGPFILATRRIIEAIGRRK
jgi:hypothetical protein